MSFEDRRQALWDHMCMSTEGAEAMRLADLYADELVADMLRKRSKRGRESVRARMVEARRV